MESTVNREAKVFRNKERIAQLLRDYAQSGLTVKAFCADVHIAEGTFYNWKKKYGDAEKTGFTPVEIVTSGASGLFAEVGHIRIFQPVSAAYLKELVG